MKILSIALALTAITRLSAAPTNDFSAKWPFWSMGVQVYSQITSASNFSGAGLAGLENPHLFRATRGEGLQGLTNGPQRTWAFSTPAYATFDEAIAADAYIEIFLTPKSGFEVQLAEISLLTTVGGGSIEVGLFSSKLGFDSAFQLGNQSWVDS